MAILGIGCDLEKVARFEKHLAIPGADAFARRFFTEEELRYSLSGPKPAERLAARFCAKEAFFKALGTGVAGNLSLAQVEVVRDGNGKPSLVPSGPAAELAKARGVKKIFLSLSHTESEALAFVILETE